MKFIRTHLVCASLFLSTTAELLTAAPSEETVFYDLPEALEPSPIPSPTADLAALPGYPADPDQLTVAARLYLPDPNVHGNGPYPTVIVLHGSGGLWSNDIIANGLISQFEQWGDLLAAEGYAAIFPDSYNPRGIPANFGSRRPHHDPAIDDHLCSPNYERPKDVVATLAYLLTRPEIDTDNLALMGFSHGAQTAMNAIVDASVDLGQYTVSYIDVGNVSTTKNVPSPVRIPEEFPFPKVTFLYYGGGGHYNYHGSPSSTAAGRFMFDRRTQVVLFHGTDDYLLGVDDPEAAPMTGNLYPIKQVLASSAQAAAENVEDPFQIHYLLHLATHSFDLEPLAPQGDWNTPNESADQKAKRLCREEVLKWLQATLRPAPAITLTFDEQAPQNVELTHPSHPRLRYQWRRGLDLVGWTELGNAFNGDGSPIQTVTPDGDEPFYFYYLNYEPVPPPVDAPENAGFFRDYADFDL